jgi:hypothetical protein
MANNPQEAEVEYSLIKIIILGAVFIATALFFGYALREFVLVINLNQFLYLLIALVLFLSFFALVTIFTKSFKVGALMVFLGTSAATIIFYKSFSLILLSASLFAFLLLLAALASGQSKIKNVLKIKFLKIAKPVISKGSTALALFIVIIFVSSINLTEAKFLDKAIDFLIKPDFLIKLAGPLLGDMPLGDQAFPLDKSLGEILSAQLPAEYAALPQAVKDKAINEAIKKLEQQISSVVKIKIKPSDTLKDIIRNLVLEKLAASPKSTQNLILAGLGIILFLFLRSGLFIINYFVLPLTFLFYKILFMAGFFHVTLESRGKEVIILR